MELLVKQDQEHVVCNVELILLNFVIRAPVFAFPELVVSTAILVPVSPYCGWYRSCVT